MSIVFDTVISELKSFFKEREEALKNACPILINRDMTGRVCLIMEKRCQDEASLQPVFEEIRKALPEKIAPHVVTDAHLILFEENLEDIKYGLSTFRLEDVDLDISVIDRLISGGDWSRNPAKQATKPRIVFFSIKGGVGRSTALAVSAYALAESGKKVLVVDLDLESPGLSSSLLPEDRRPDYGIVDWLVEDLVDNGPVILDNMVGISDLSRDGDIRVVPAHGRNTGEYIPKLGRIWMPKRMPNNMPQQPWTERLRRLLDRLENMYNPDVILIDSRAGIDEIASANVTSLGATRVLLFAIDGVQTWQGYSILFRHWGRYGLSTDIGQFLQVVAAMVPEIDRLNYIKGLCENSWNLFTETLYESIPAGASADESETIYFNFDKDDSYAPHYPWPVLWTRGLATLYSYYGTDNVFEPSLIEAQFGKLIDGIKELAEMGEI